MVLVRKPRGPRSRPVNTYKRTCKFCGIFVSSVGLLVSHVRGFKHTVTMQNLFPQQEERLGRLQYFMDTYVIDKDPLLGLEHIEEFLEPDGTYAYTCGLCYTAGSWHEIFRHIIGDDHMSTYMDHQYANVVPETEEEANPRKKVHQILRNTALLLQERDGRKEIKSATPQSPKKAPVPAGGNADEVGHCSSSEPVNRRARPPPPANRKGRPPPHAKRKTRPQHKGWSFPPPNVEQKEWIFPPAERKGMPPPEELDEGTPPPEERGGGTPPRQVVREERCIQEERLLQFFRQKALNEEQQRRDRSSSPGSDDGAVRRERFPSRDTSLASSQERDIRKEVSQEEEERVLQYFHQRGLSEERLERGDLSPQRRDSRERDLSPKRFDRRDRDLSPHRYERRERDLSPQRYERRERDLSPQRYDRRECELSPQRYDRRERNLSPQRYDRRERDVSPQHYDRRERDLSPQRYDRRERELSPQWLNRRERDLSPQRDNRRERDLSPQRFIRRERDLSPQQYHSRERDLSPQRYIRRERDMSPQRYDRRERDLSPQRYDRREQDLPQQYDRRERDLSPQLYNRRERDFSPQRYEHRAVRRDRSPPERRRSPHFDNRNYRDERCHRDKRVPHYFENRAPREERPHSSDRWPPYPECREIDSYQNEKRRRYLDRPHPEERLPHDLEHRGVERRHSRSREHSPRGYERYPERQRHSRSRELLEHLSSEERHYDPKPVEKRCCSKESLPKSSGENGKRSQQASEERSCSGERPHGHQSKHKSHSHSKERLPEHCAERSENAKRSHSRSEEQTSPEEKRQKMPDSKTVRTKSSHHKEKKLTHSRKKHKHSSREKPKKKKRSSKDQSELCGLEERSNETYSPQRESFESLPISEEHSEKRTPQNSPPQLEGMTTIRGSNPDFLGYPQQFEIDDDVSYVRTISRNLSHTGIGSLQEDTGLRWASERDNPDVMITVSDSESETEDSDPTSKPKEVIVEETQQEQLLGQQDCPQPYGHSSLPVAGVAELLMHTTYSGFPDSETAEEAPYHPGSDQCIEAVSRDKAKPYRPKATITSLDFIPLDTSTDMAVDEEETGDAQCPRPWGSHEPQCPMLANQNEQGASYFSEHKMDNNSWASEKTLPKKPTYVTLDFIPLDTSFEMEVDEKETGKALLPEPQGCHEPQSPDRNDQAFSDISEPEADDTSCGSDMTLPKETPKSSSEPFLGNPAIDSKFLEETKVGELQMPQKCGSPMPAGEFEQSIPINSINEKDSPSGSTQALPDETPNVTSDPLPKDKAVDVSNQAKADEPLLPQKCAPLLPASQCDQGTSSQSLDSTTTQPDETPNPTIEPDIEALELFFSSVKTMEESEVIDAFREISATNPAFRGFDVPAVIRYLKATGRLKCS